VKNQIVFILALIVTSFSTAHAQKHVRIIAKDAFLYVRMTKEMLGGNIEVRDSSGQVVSTKSIDHRKMYMDLFELADGKYNVTVKHDNLIIEFSYTVESPQLHAKRKHHGNDHTEILSEKAQVRYV
jgi:hypothetical protein